MKHFLSILSLIAISFFSNAQTWQEAMFMPNANLYDVQQKFETYWVGKDITEKGKGYKVFKRWENFAAPRVYPSGDLGLLSQTAKNYEDFLVGYKALQASEFVNSKHGSGNLIASTTWTPMGPFGALTGSAGGQLNKNGRLCFITIHPTNSLTIFVGAGAGGLWQSTNGGTSWTTNTDNLGVIGCSDLAIDPITPTIMYLATGDGDAGDTKSIGVLKSTDGGVTWAVTGLTFAVNAQVLIRRLIINPVNTQILLAATSNGIYRTINGGTSWTPVNASNCYDLEFQPNAPTIVYSAGTSFRRSTDGGATWTQISNGIPTTGITRMAIAVTPADVNRVYVLAGNNTNSGMLGVYQSVNTGTAFTTISPGGGVNLLGWNSNGLDLGGQDWYDLAIAASPTNAAEVVTGGVNVWRTTDAGATWAIYGHWTGSGAPFIHADHHDLDYNSSGVLYGCNDGTVYKRTGATWTEICGSINISQIYKLGTSALTANKWISGHQDNGTNIWNSVTYTCSIGGDGMDCFIDRTNDNNMFGETYSGSFRRSTNGGANWSAYTTGMSGTAPWVSIWKQDPQTANTIYGGYSNLFKSILSTGTWTQLAALPAGGTINEFAIAPSNSLIIYVLKNSAVYKTINGGTSWTTNNTGITFGGAPTFITISPTDPNKAWITLSGYSPGNKVFQTINGGTSWTNFSANLPNLPANCSVYQSGTNDRIYVGMDVGLYYRDNLAANWTLYNTGLPNTPLADLEISPADPTKLIAATYGRGVWKVDVVQNLPPVSSFNYTGSICVSTPKVFNDLSVNGPTTWTWSVLPALGVTINLPSTQNPTITFPNAGNYTVSLQTSNLIGVGTTTTQTVAVIANPSITVTNSVQNICSGTSASITASGATSYSWNTGALTNTVSVSPVSTTVYTVNGTTSGCTSAAKFATVNVTTSPVINVNNPAICSPSNIILNASGATNYTWSTGALTSSTSVTPSITSIYTVTGKTGTCSTVKTSTVTIYGLPSINASADATMICEGNGVTLSGSGANTYTWQPGNLVGPSVTDAPLATVVYTCIGTDANNCVGTQTILVTVSICAGILQNGLEKIAFNVYPNPASENIIINYAVTNSTELGVELLDASGKLIIQKTNLFNKGNPNFNINISTISKGIYYLKLIPKDGASKTIKLVKE